jgi:hypothetical protein
MNTLVPITVNPSLEHVKETVDRFIEQNNEPLDTATLLKGL